MSKKIILGSSSITILKEVEWNLTDTDYEIIPANDIDDFRQSMKSQGPDLLIIDRDMQEGSGVSLCNEIKSDQAFAQLPLIVLVKKAEDGGDEQLESLGKDCKADKVLGVPLESAKLLSTVQYFMAKQSAASDPLTKDLSGKAGPAKEVEAHEAPSELLMEEMPQAGAEMPEAQPEVGQGDGAQEPFAGFEDVLEGIEISPVEASPEGAAGPEPAGADTGEAPSDLLMEEMPQAGAETSEAQPEAGQGDGAQEPFAGFEDVLEGIEINPVEEPPEGAAGPEPAGADTGEAPSDLLMEEMPQAGAEMPEAQPEAPQVGPKEGDAILREGEVEHPTLSAEEALEETIKVVEEAIRRGRDAEGDKAGVESPQAYAQSEDKQQQAAPSSHDAHASPADAGGEEGLSQEQVQQSVLDEFFKATSTPGESADKPIEAEGASPAPPVEKEGEETAGGVPLEKAAPAKPLLDMQEMETRLKEMLQEQMHTLAEQSIPEMTKRLVQEHMNQVISQSVPDLTRNLIQEQITKLTEQSIPEMTKRIVQEHMNQAISQSVPELAKNLIREQLGNLTQQAVPELTKRLVQEHMKQMVTQAIPELTRNLIQEQMGRLTEQALPEMTKKMIQEKLAHIIDEKKIAHMVLNEINQNVERRVPDLAEKIIREEIEHIKQGYG
ncbi:MAG: response regulator [bacterium]